MEDKRTKQYEFSKVIFWLVWITNLLVIVFCELMIFLNFLKNGYAELTLMNVLIPSTTAELASATGFYYWKKRANNIYEYGEKFILDLVENDNIDSEYVVAISQAFFSSQQFTSLTK